jgi:hypothetical protein
MAFEQVHGRLGPQRLDFLAAMICQTIANTNRDPKKKPIPITKFMPDWDQGVELGDDP